MINVKVASAKNEFLKHLGGHKLEALAPPDGIRLMLSFYREVRVEGGRPDADGDMLLYQWGTYDWGEGEAFDIDITRQLIVGNGGDEDIFQLSLTFKFPPAEQLRQLGEGTRWCHSPEELEEFQAFINSSPALIASEHEKTSEVRLEYGVAG